MYNKLSIVSSFFFQKMCYKETQLYVLEEFEKLLIWKIGLSVISIYLFDSSKGTLWLTTSWGIMFYKYIMNFCPLRYLLHLV